LIDVSIVRFYTILGYNANVNKISVKYRLFPNHVQQRTLNETLVVCRGVYNSLVHERTVCYETQGKSPTLYQQQKAITAWKPNNAELKTIHSQVLQNVAVRVELAFQAFFRRVKSGETPGYPRLKGKGQYDSITYPQGGYSVGQSTVTLSKIGQVKAKIHRVCPGTIKTCTVRKDGEKWYVCFSCEYEAVPLPPCTDSVGIDVGLKTFAALSNGEFIENPRFFRKEESTLAKAQRRFDKVKDKHGSKERKSAKKVVRRVHERVKNRRHNFVHQQSRQLVNRFGVISVEKLNVKGMVKNHCLAKSISDASWTQFRNALTMKAESAGRLVVAVSPAYTSQNCSSCGYRAKKKLSERWHHCPMCGLVLDRDTNAAVNLQVLGLNALGQQSVAN
jgi:putative transposase